MNYRVYLPLLLIALAACKKPMPVPQAALPTPPKPALSSYEREDSLLLVAIFGQATRRAGHNDNHFFAAVSADSSRLTPEHLKALDVPNDFVFEYVIAHKAEISIARQQKWLVVLSSQGMSCHVCSGLCGAAVLTKTGDQWHLETLENDIAVLGSSGNPAEEIEIKPCGPDKYAIVMRTGNISQGVVVKALKVSIFMENRFEDATDKAIIYASDNWNNFEHGQFSSGYGYSSNVDFESGDRPVWDMVLHFQGTQLPEAGTKPFLLDRKVRFRFENGLYRTKDKLPQEND